MSEAQVQVTSATQQPVLGAGMDLEEQSMTQQPTLDTEELTVEEGLGGVSSSDEELLIADSDDPDRMATFKGTDFEDLDEEAIIASMGTGDQIRSSTTVPTGEYIISFRKLRFKQDITLLGKTNANGDIIPGPMKSIGFRVGIHMDMKSKEMMNDNMYQLFYTARKDGSPFETGRTEYKRFCAAAVSAVMLPDNPKATMKAVLLNMDRNKINPAQLFNQVAASDDDNLIYLRAQIKETPESDKGPASNSIIVTSIKDDKGYYQQLINS